MPHLFSGKEALREVAKEDGTWNWALVGPKPNELPLRGGGAGGVEEMRGPVSLLANAQAFGLLRVNFEDGPAQLILIHALGSSCSPDERPQDASVDVASVELEMERAIGRLGKFSAKVQLRSKEECSIEHIYEAYRNIVGAEKTPKTPTVVPTTKSAQTLQWIQERQEVARRLTTMVETKTIDTIESDGQSDPESDALLQRRRVKLFNVGDFVKVYSRKDGEWLDDGEVTDVVLQACVKEGVQIRAGSTRVIYANHRRHKWLSPLELERNVVASMRPKPPKSCTGYLLLEMNSWLGTNWKQTYVEVNRGFLQWWDTMDAAAEKSKPAGSMYLLGLEQDSEDLTIRMLG